MANDFETSIAIMLKSLSASGIANEPKGPQRQRMVRRRICG